MRLPSTWVKTTDPQGTPYEIRLLHTKGGKPAELQGQQAPITQQNAPGGDTYIYVLGGKGQKKEDPGADFLSSYLQDSLFAQQPQIKSAINPAALLTSAFSQTPNFMT